MTQAAVGLPKGTHFARQAALYSLVTPLFAVSLTAVVSVVFFHPSGAAGESGSAVHMVAGIFSWLLLLSGLGAGIVAIFMAMTKKITGVYLKAGIGVGLNGAIVCGVVIVVVAALLLRRSAPVDHSLTAAAYAVKGLPTIDHPWQASDYDTAITVLQQVGTDDPNALPRWKSKTSGDVFAAFGSADTFKQTHDAQPSLQEKLLFAGRIAQKFGGVFGVYEDATKKKAQYDDEVIELENMALQSEICIIDDMQSVMAGLPADDARRQDLQDRMGRLQSGIRETIEGAALIPSDTTIGLESRKRYVGYLAGKLPPLFKALSPEQQSGFLVLLHEDMNKITDPDLKASMLTVYADLTATQLLN